MSCESIEETPVLEFSNPRYFGSHGTRFEYPGFCQKATIFCCSNLFRILHWQILLLKGLQWDVRLQKSTAENLISVAQSTTI